MGVMLGGSDKIGADQPSFEFVVRRERQQGIGTGAGQSPLFQNQT